MDGISLNDSPFIRTAKL